MVARPGRIRHGPGCFCFFYISPYKEKEYEFFAQRLRSVVDFSWFVELLDSRRRTVAATCTSATRFGSGWALGMGDASAGQEGQEGSQH